MPASFFAKTLRRGGFGVVWVGCPCVGLGVGVSVFFDVGQVLLFVLVVVLVSFFCCVFIRVLVWLFI